MNESAQPGQTYKNFARTAESIALVVAVATSVVLVSWVIWRAGFGYEFSDEGSYLNWISTPQLYKASVSQYGFIYHPLYYLADGNVVLLRRINILITLGLAWILCYLALRIPVITLEPDETRPILPRVGVSFVLSTATLALLTVYWLPTPSYNSLTLQALLIAGMGLLLTDSDISAKNSYGWILLGLSGWLAFMAKPTSALALGIVTCVFLLLTRKFKPRMIGECLLIAAILGFLSAWFIDGSVERFIWRLVSGAEDAKILEGRHTLHEAFRFDNFQFSSSEKYCFAVATFLIFLATIVGAFNNTLCRVAGSVLCLIFSAACLLIAAEVVSPPLSHRQFSGLQFLAIPSGAMLAVVVLSFRRFSRLISYPRLVSALSFVLFPYVYVIGTNSNYWERASEAAVFWILAAGLLLNSLNLPKISWRGILALATGAQLCTATLLFVSMETPYRQTQALRKNEYALSLPGGRSNLFVSRDFAEYIDKLHLLAANAGFRVGDPMIDLTGHYPGALFALGAKSIGRPWMIGNYKGSDALAIASLDRVSQMELRHAWILAEPTGPRRLSTDILKRYGIDLEKDYVEVGTVDSPTGSYPDSYKQHLLKPKM